MTDFTEYAGYMGDYDIREGGTFVDVSQWDNGVAELMRVCELSDEIANVTVLSILIGSTLIPPKGDETYAGLAEFNGDPDLEGFDPATADHDMRVFMAEQLRAYHGMGTHTMEYIIADVEIDAAHIQKLIETGEPELFSDELKWVMPILEYKQTRAILCEDAQTAAFLTGFSFATGYTTAIRHGELEDYIAEIYDLSAYK